MTRQEYEQKKQECWEEYKIENLVGEVQWQPVSRYDVFCEAFDRAYALGKHEKDAEGEDEMLHVSRKQIDLLQGEIFKAIMDAHDADDWQDAAHYILDVMPRSFATLFGSKCLPDDQSAKTAHCPSTDAENSEKPNLSKEPKFKVGDKVYCCYGGKRLCKVISINRQIWGDVYQIKDVNYGNVGLYHEQWLEPYSEPEGTHQNRHVPESGKSGTNTETITGNSETPNFPEGFDGVHPVANKKVVDDILRNTLARERRLDIAAKALQAILSNPDRMNRYEKIAQQSSGTLTGLVASNALRYADALIAAWSTT